MKLKELKPVLRSVTGDICMCVVWSHTRCEDLVCGCSVEYAIANYGENTLERIYVDNTGELVLSIIED